jgi:phenylacetate-coenzyme A ligase PaaK-like adenylate-forming protein
MSFQIAKIEELEQEIFRIEDEDHFVKTAIHVFNFQYQNNKLYREYCNLMHCEPNTVKTISQIPFLPISFFKTHTVQTTLFEPQIIFESSGTTGSINSRHLIKDVSLYEKSFLKTFAQFYGKVSEYCFLGLLPSYLEKGNSSLVYMVNNLMEDSGHPLNGFYLSDFSKLAETILLLEKQNQKTIVFGVTYALLDFAEAFPMKLENTIIMETGGMKGRRQELIRNEVHSQLKQAFQLKTIHSEYGMTELLSQAYAKEEGKFTAAPWVKGIIREEDDQRKILINNDKPVSGALNIIDLGNIYSCSFIATEDIARLHPDNSFEVLGRMDNTDIRGCSLLAL